MLNFLLAIAGVTIIHSMIETVQIPPPPAAKQIYTGFLSTKRIIFKVLLITSQIINNS